MPPGARSRVASTPFHRSSSSGSVKKSNTVSGRAPIRISRSTTPDADGSTATIAPPLLPLGCRPEARQGIVPELLDELAQLRQTLGPHAVEPPGPLAPLDDQLRLTQHAQVLGDRRARDVEVRRDLAGGQLVVTDEAKDLPSARGR